MGIFSKSCEYALRAVFFIADNSSEGKRVGIKEIAKNIDSPEPFLAKILQKLAKGDVIQSAKGPNGGFYLDESASQSTLLRIVLAIEGNDYFTTCGMGLQQCSDKNPCPLHEDFKVIRKNMTQMLDCTTIEKFHKGMRISDSLG